MKVGRSKGVLLDSPTWWKDDKVSHGGSWSVGLTGEDGEDTGILVDERGKRGWGRREKEEGRRRRRKKVR